MVAALGCSELQFREIVERSTDVVLIHSEGRIVYANPAAAWVFGAASAMFMLGRVAMTLVHPSDQAAARERILRATTTNAAVEPQEVRCVRDDRSDLRMENVALPMTSEGRPSIVVVGREITARRQEPPVGKIVGYLRTALEITERRQAQLLFNDRMASVGTLASGGRARDQPPDCVPHGQPRRHRGGSARDRGASE